MLIKAINYEIDFGNKSKTIFTYLDQILKLRIIKKFTKYCLTYQLNTILI